MMIINGDNGAVGNNDGDDQDDDYQPSPPVAGGSGREWIYLPVFTCTCFHLFKWMGRGESEVQMVLNDVVVVLMMTAVMMTTIVSDGKLCC